MNSVDKIRVVSYFRKMSKYNNHPLAQLSDIFKALGNPTRLQIFLRLASWSRSGNTSEKKRGNYVGELGRDLAVAPSTLSHHLKELQRADLIEMQRSGKNIKCSVTSGTLDELEEFFLKAGRE